MLWQRVEAAPPGGPEEGPRRRAGRRGGREGPGRKWGHTLSAVRGGRLAYVFGGYGRSQRQTNDVHVFNTVLQKWTKPYVRGTVPPPRDSHTCTTIGSRLYVFGGTDGAYGLNDLYFLDTTSNTWSQHVYKGPIVPQPREGHSAACIGMKLYVFGGCGKSVDGGDDTYFNDVYVFDPESEMWASLEPTGAPPAARDSHSCCAWGHHLVVFGGEDAGSAYLNDVHMLDTCTLEWTQVKTVGEGPQPRAGHSAVAIGRYLCVFGGFADDRHLFNDLHVLDMATGKWETEGVEGAVPSPRFSLAADLLDGTLGQVLFFGGCNENLEALGDMFILHTGLPSDVTNVLPVGEKLSLKKELKRRSQMSLSSEPMNRFGGGGAHFDDSSFNMGENEQMGSTFSHAKVDPSSIGGVMDARSHLDRSFEGRITDVFHFGYCVEAKVDNVLLEGLLFSFRPGFTQAAYTRMAVRRTEEREKLSQQIARRREKRKLAKAAEAPMGPTLMSPNGILHNHQAEREISSMQPSPPSSPPPPPPPSSSPPPPPLPTTTPSSHMLSTPSSMNERGNNSDTLLPIEKSNIQSVSLPVIPTTTSSSPALPSFVGPSTTPQMVSGMSRMSATELLHMEMAQSQAQDSHHMQTYL